MRRFVDAGLADNDRPVGRSDCDIAFQDAFWTRLDFRVRRMESRRSWPPSMRHTLGSGPMF
jgi:hypothetical protein